MSIAIGDILIFALGTIFGAGIASCYVKVRLKVWPWDS